MSASYAQQQRDKRPALLLESTLDELWCFFGAASKPGMRGRGCGWADGRPVVDDGVACGTEAIDRESSALGVLAEYRASEPHLTLFCGS